MSGHGTALPFSSANADAINAINYFGRLPNEMLVEIFGHLQPVDLANCFHVCARWEAILEIDEFSILFGAALPHISKFLNWNEHLNLRSTCSKVKRQVDNYVDGVNTCAVPPCVLRYQKNRSYYSEEDLTRMLDEIPPSRKNRNPFPGRSVNFTSSRDGIWSQLFGLEENPNYWTKAANLLNVIGHHIHFLRLFASDGQHSLGRNLLRCLSQTPNLRGLEVRGLQSTSYGGEGQSQWHQLRICLLTENLAKLPHLTQLNLHYLPNQIYGKLLKEYGGQLESLQCGIAPASIETVEFLHLRELCVRHIGISRLELERLVDCTAPALQKLTLHSNFGPRDVPPLFRVLKALGGNLEEIEICGKASPIHTPPSLVLYTPNWEEFGELHLPRLNKFTVKDTDLISYDFIDGLSQCLKHFEIHVKTRVWNSKKHVLNKESLGIEGFGRGCICKSAVWTKLLTLQSVRIIDSEARKTLLLCTRENYLRTLEKKRAWPCSIV